MILATAMPTAHKLRELTLASGVRPFLASASGLVRVGEWLYVIADDEVSLGIFPAAGTAPGRRLRLFDAASPPGAALPKAVKPDLEVLTHLPAAACPPHGALTFTDASPLPGGRLVFSAVAEDTPDAYADGPCAGAAIGLLDAECRVLSLEPLHPVLKVEGVHATVEPGRVSLLLVADGDDPQRPAPLLSAELEV